MKKILALLLVLAMALSLVACGGEKAAVADSAAAEYRVAMITDYADITDQSFNQTTWEACLAFGEKTGTEVKYYKPVTEDNAGRVAWWRRSQRASVSCGASRWKVPTSP